MQPAVAGQELVGQFVSFQEVDQMLESNGVLRADVGSTTLNITHGALYRSPEDRIRIW